MPIKDPISVHNTAYVLVTPVRNEEALIGRTISSVLNQTILPREWMIVSDGSTDSTNAIIEAAIQENPWIKLVKLPQRDGPSFAAVVHNTTLGINKLSTNSYEFLGLLDSDLEFQANYFELLINEFHRAPTLGIAGGVAIDIGQSRERLPRNLGEVPGALQFFRRECFRAIDGLIPVPEGGWDCITCTTARMKGYETRLVTKLVVDHLKPRNIIHGGILKRKKQMGIRDYALGYHPLFEFIKCACRLLSERPIVIGSLAWYYGYISACLSRHPRLIPPEVMQYMRSEQIKRLFGN